MAVTAAMAARRSQTVYRGRSVSGRFSKGSRVKVAPKCLLYKGLRKQCVQRARLLIGRKCVRVSEILGNFGYSAGAADRRFWAGNGIWGGAKSGNKGGKERKKRDFAGFILWG
jgi:hypothetical protein